MSRWWYWTQYECPECGEKWEVYDASGSNYDSGYSGPVPVQKEMCRMCVVYDAVEDV